MTYVRFKYTYTLHTYGLCAVGFFFVRHFKMCSCAVGLSWNEWVNMEYVCVWWYAMCSDFVLKPHDYYILHIVYYSMETKDMETIHGIVNHKWINKHSVAYEYIELCSIMTQQINSIIIIIIYILNFDRSVYHIQPYMSFEFIHFSHLLACWHRSSVICVCICSYGNLNLIHIRCDILNDVYVCARLWNVLVLFSWFMFRIYINILYIFSSIRWSVLFIYFFFRFMISIEM